MLTGTVKCGFRQWWLAGPSGSLIAKRSLAEHTADAEWTSAPIDRLKFGDQNANTAPMS